MQAFVTTCVVVLIVGIYAPELSNWLDKLAREAKYQIVTRFRAIVALCKARMEASETKGDSDMTSEQMSQIVAMINANNQAILAMVASLAPEAPSLAPSLPSEAPSLPSLAPEGSDDRTVVMTTPIVVASEAPEAPEQSDLDSYVSEQIAAMEASETGAMVASEAPSTVHGVCSLAFNVDNTVASMRLDCFPGIVYTMGDLWKRGIVSSETIGRIYARKDTYFVVLGSDKGNGKVVACAISPATGERLARTTYRNLTDRGARPISVPTSYDCHYVSEAPEAPEQSKGNGASKAPESSEAPSLPSKAPEQSKASEAPKGNGASKADRGPFVSRAYLRSAPSTYGDQRIVVVVNDSATIYRDDEGCIQWCAANSSKGVKVQNGRKWRSHGSPIVLTVADLESKLSKGTYL